MNCWYSGIYLMFGVLFFGYWLQNILMTFYFLLVDIIIIETSLHSLLHVHENIKRMKEWCMHAIYVHSINYIRFKKFISMYILSDFDFFVKYAINKCVN